MRIAGLEELPDEDLVRLFTSSKDGDALEVLLLRHESKVFGLAYRILGNRQDALDVAQEVFIGVFRKAGSFQYRSAFATWLFRLTSNACKDFIRKSRRTPTPMEITETAGRSESDGYDTAVKHLDLHKALLSLDLEQRTVVVMRDIYELSYEEIAQATGSPEGTVKSRIARGREKLAQLMIGPLAEPPGDLGRLS